MTRSIQSDLQSDLRRQLLGQLQSEGYLIPEASSDRDICVTWAGVKLRQIPRRRRKVRKSEELRRGNLSQELSRGVQKICVASEHGKNLNPHLSRKHLDAAFNDLLFNDWTIHHMHLGPRGGKKTGRTGALLFVRVTEEFLYLVDVRDHYAFGDLELLRIIKRNFPEVLPLAETGISRTEHETTPAEYVEARQGGVLSLVQLDGVVYMPTNGIVTTGQSSRAVSAADEVVIWVHRLERSFHTHPELWVEQVSRKTGSAPTEMRMKLLLGGLEFSILEANTGALVECFNLQLSRP